MMCELAVVEADIEVEDLLVHSKHTFAAGSPIAGIAGAVVAEVDAALAGYDVE